MAMRTRTTLLSGLLALGLGLPATAGATDRVAGTVVAVDGDVYVLDLGGESGVSPGSVLQVYRRLPGERGTAAYRDAAMWWEVGQLTVSAIGDDMAVATWSGPPREALPSGLDESGAPADLIHVGDRVRATAAVGLRPTRVRVSFATRDLFAVEEFDLAGEGERVLSEWLRGLKSIEGPIEIEVHPRIAELGEGTPDLSRQLSLGGDAPFGPAPGEPTVPVEGLYEDAPEPVNVPEAREVLVVDQTDGKPDVWHYLDPISLARRRGERVAAALAVHVGLAPEAVLVRVVPRPTTTHEMAVKTPGYDVPEDQLRILATSIDWAEPPEKPRRVHKKKKKDEGEKEVPKTHRRRILEKPPEDMT